MSFIEKNRMNVEHSSSKVQYASQELFIKFDLYNTISFIRPIYKEQRNRH